MHTFFLQEMESSLSESLTKLEEAKKSKEIADEELKTSGKLAEDLKETVVHVKKLEANVKVIN